MPKDLRKGFVKESLNEFKSNFWTFFKGNSREIPKVIFEELLKKITEEIGGGISKGIAKGIPKTLRTIFQRNFQRNKDNFQRNCHNKPNDCFDASSKGIAEDIFK